MLDMLLKPWAWVLTLLYTLLWGFLSAGTSDAVFGCTVNLVAIGYLLLVADKFGILEGSGRK